jgi:NAD(P)-dependent dehydrogenase (short-subunit alcohol dehydrogenase family)
MKISFEDKVVLITGAGSGLGRIYALEFARRGAIVIINDIGPSIHDKDSVGAAWDVLMEVDEHGGRGMASNADITSRDAVEAMVDETMTRFGRIDILINNAGIMSDVAFANLTADEYGPVLDVHLVGTLRLTRTVWPIMCKQAYGRIMVTTSASGLYGASGQAHYSAAKLGVVGLINTLKLEGQKYNIRCNALAPVAYTSSTTSLYPPEAEALMRPEQVTAGVLFLCSERAPNGAILCAGGGGFTRAEICESQGVFLTPDEVSPEAVADNWDTISDMTNARAHTMAGEQLGKFFAMSKK